MGEGSTVNYKTRIINIGVIILALIVAFKIYKSQSQSLELLKQEKQLEIKKNETLEDISKLGQKIKSYKDLVNNKDISSAINSISNIAKDTGLKIISIKPAGEENFPLYMKYPFELTAHSGNYSAIGKFISGLENSPDIFMVDLINIVPVRNSEEVTADSAATYYLSFDLRVSTIIFK